MSQTLNYSWQLSGSGWAINYDATVTISVSRAYGSDIAKVTASGSMHTPVGNGDSNATWKFWIKIGSASYTKTISSGYHAPDRRDSFSYSWDITVGANSGTLSGSADFQAYDNNNGFGSWAGEKSWSQSYGTKGASTIASATNVNLNTAGNATGTVTFTSYSSSFKHQVWATIGNTSTSVENVDGGNNVSTTATLTFGTAFINAINTAKSGTATVYLKTLSGNTQIGSTASKTITLTVPGGINPSVSAITFTKVSALSSTYFSGKICTLIDKVQVGWTEATSYGSAINTRSVNVNNETLSSATNNATTTTALTNYGAQSANVTITDKRGNSGTLASNALNVYRYFYPSVNIKYNHSGTDYKVTITGSIAYVGGDNAKALILNVYKGESTTATGTYTLTSSISTQTGGTYDAEYPINIEYTIPTTAITDIDTDTYRFEVTATDTVTSVVAKVYSGITVMTLEAEGAGVIMRKPVTFEQGVKSFTVLAQNDASEGGQIDFKGAGSYTNAMYIDRLQDQFRAIRYDGSTNYIFNQNMVAPWQLEVPGVATISSSNTNGLTSIAPYTYHYATLWCNNATDKPSGSGQYGICVCQPRVQTYHEYLGQATTPNRIWIRQYTNSAWTTWQLIPVWGSIKNGAVTVSSGSIAAGATKWVSASPASGHHLISYNGYYFQNNNGTSCTAYASYIDVSDGKMWVAIKNWASSAANPNVIFSYSYI